MVVGEVSYDVGQDASGECGLTSGKPRRCLMKLRANTVMPMRPRWTPSNVVIIDEFPVMRSADLSYEFIYRHYLVVFSPVPMYN